MHVLGYHLRRASELSVDLNISETLGPHCKIVLNRQGLNDADRQPLSGKGKNVRHVER